jgi:hypothetical protein
MIISAQQITAAHNTRVFMKDLKGNIFRVHSSQTLKLETCGRIRVGGHIPHSDSDIRVSYALMFNDAHESVKGLKVIVIKFHDFKVVNGEAFAKTYAETVTI